ncbi:DUF397 domain-containing protein [Kitasatospora sp. NBC_01287]|uniref:DUF397 domain-containing protein n=1 Tax=Kitasatospora sp. NBC_01287 TaxID=2903573 RepID=UPI00225AC5DE|nr:DUF397 domain-containing protein [Kitasatospora sp. NBC_01287]MCX4750048.1 DUF397 domain-containing protein [Kitasatospora sp. NBC_01287]
MSSFPNASALAVRWQKSSWSNEDGNCVECAAASGDIAVRDSKDPAGPALQFSPQAWTAFAGAVGAGRLAVADS